MTRSNESVKHEIKPYPSSPEEAKRRSIGFYRDAKPCRNKHFEDDGVTPRERYASTGRCVACVYGVYGSTESGQATNAEYARQRRAAGLVKPREEYRQGLPSADIENALLMPPWLVASKRVEYDKPYRRKHKLRIDHTPIPRNACELIHGLTTVGNVELHKEPRSAPLKSTTTAKNVKPTSPKVSPSGKST